MGWCFEFGTRIGEGCDHLMVADTKSCSCPSCGTVCTGRFTGCARVWARSGDASPQARAVDLSAKPEPGPTADGVVAAIRDPTSTDSTYGPASQPRKLRAIVGITIAVVGFAGFITVRAVGGDSDGASAVRVVPPTQAVLSLPPIAVTDGVEASRRWRLDGHRGNRFTARIVFSNSTTAPVHVVYDEAIPKDLAADAGAVRFDPMPQVIEADPVVRYEFDLAPGSSMTAAYAIDVDPDGARKARLEKWAGAAELELAQRVEVAREAAAAAQAAAEAQFWQALAAQQASRARSSKPAARTTPRTTPRTAPPTPIPTAPPTVPHTDPTTEPTTTATTAATTTTTT